jgi:hypothetical protein
VLLEFAEPAVGLRDAVTVTISYRAIARYSGITSHNPIRNGLVALKERCDTSANHFRLL